MKNLSHALLTTSIVMLTVGCSSEMGSPNNNLSAARVPVTLMLGPNPATVASSQSLQLTVSNGTGPFNFSVSSGSCMVSMTTGLLYGSASTGSCLVQVQDGSGNTGLLNVAVTASTQIAVTYSWGQSGFSQCSAAANGIQTQSVYCQSTSGSLVPNSYCATAGVMPATSQACNVIVTAPQPTFGHWVPYTVTVNDPNVYTVLGSPGCDAYFFLSSPINGAPVPPTSNVCINVGAFCQVGGYYGPGSPNDYVCTR